VLSTECAYKKNGRVFLTLPLINLPEGQSFGKSTSEDKQECPEIVYSLRKRFTRNIAKHRELNETLMVHFSKKTTILSEANFM